MFKKFIILIMCLIVIGCPLPNDENIKNTNLNYTIKIVDGCEYIEYAKDFGTGLAVYSLTHKGNCKNPIHSCPTK